MGQDDTCPFLFILFIHCKLVVMKYHFVYASQKSGTQ